MTRLAEVFRSEAATRREQKAWARSIAPMCRMTREVTERAARDAEAGHTSPERVESLRDNLARLKAIAAGVRRLRYVGAVRELDELVPPLEAALEAHEALANRDQREAA